MLDGGFPPAKTLPGASIMCFTSVQMMVRPCLRVPFWRGVWHHFRPWKCIGAQGCVLLALGRSQSVPQCAPRRPKVPKGTPKARFQPSLGDPFGAHWRACPLCEKHIIYHISSHGATLGLSTVALLTSLETECGPEPAFLCPLAPTGAPKRRRRSS